MYKILARRVFTRVFSLSLTAVLVASAGGNSRAADAPPPPIEAYGELPRIRSMAISPNGKRVAYLQRDGDREALVVTELGHGPIGGVFTDKLKTRGVAFADDDHVILGASATTNLGGLTDKFELTGAFSYSISRKEVVQLLRREEKVYFAQSGVGRIIGYEHGRDGAKRALMPAFAETDSGAPPLALFRVDLNTGDGVLAVRGTPETTDFLVDAAGEVIAREDFDEKADKYRLRVKAGGEWRVALEASGEIAPYSAVGTARNASEIVFSGVRNFLGHETLSSLTVATGAIDNAFLSRIDRSIEDIIDTQNRGVLGARFSGLYPEYLFVDSEIDKAVRAAQAALPSVSVELVSWTEDFSRIVVYAHGTGLAGRYYLFDRARNVLMQLADDRPGIRPDQVGIVLSIEYKARDGLKIPGVLTLPSNGETKNLPLIVMPHGGPESYDAVGFDWMAQYFASRGYMILQPNFRGSEGFGAVFRNAGRGEWGGKMQDDVTDGVNALIRSGRADPNKVCIMGASYGGYSALAGGAFTPDLYKCVVAIAGVSDIPGMWREEIADRGKESSVFAYWKRVIGDPATQREKLKRISPVNSAAMFKAPVLLIHGKDDTVVPIRQSEVMERALREAGKTVEFVKLKGEDHWLSRSETRLATLKAASEFVHRHIGNSAAPAP
jgi:dipeptidyl aminopeptidase/acylaminoacyl peptidase